MRQEIKSGHQDKLCVSFLKKRDHLRLFYLPSIQEAFCQRSLTNRPPVAVATAACVGFGTV